MAEEHVRGRMPLESNPGNRNPAIPPVFDTTGEEDYRRVTPDNPLPTKDKKLDERLTAIENKLDNVIENGAINTQLSGSIMEDELPVVINKNVEVVYVKSGKTEGVYIPAGMTIRLDEVDMSKYSEFMVQFRPGASGTCFGNYVIRSLWHQASTFTPAFNQTVGKETDKTGNWDTEWFQVKGVKATFSIENRMDEEKTFSD